MHGYDSLAYHAQEDLLEELEKLAKEYDCVFEGIYE